MASLPPWAQWVALVVSVIFLLGGAIGCYVDIKRDITQTQTEVKDYHEADNKRFDEIDRKMDSFRLLLPLRHADKY